MSSYFRYFLQQQTLGLILIGSLQAASSTLPPVQQPKYASFGKVLLGTGGTIAAGIAFYYGWSRVQKKRILRYEQEGKKLCNQVRSYTNFEELLTGLNLMASCPLRMQHNKTRFCATVAQITPQIIEHEYNSIFEDIEENDPDDYEKTVEDKLKSRIEAYKNSWILQTKQAEAHALGFDFSKYIEEIQKKCKERIEKEFYNNLIVRWSDKISQKCASPRSSTESHKDHILNFFKRLNQSSDDSSIEEARLVFPKYSTLKIRICGDKASPMPQFYDYCNDIRWQQLYDKANRGNIKQHKKELQKIDNLILKYREDHDGDDSDIKAKESLLQSISSVLEQLLNPFEQNTIKGIESPIPGIPYTTIRVVAFAPCKDHPCKYPVDFDEKTSMGLSNRSSPKKDYLWFKIDINDLVPEKNRWLKSSRIRKIVPKLYEALSTPPSRKEGLPFALNAKNDLLEVPATLAHEAAHALLAHPSLKKMFPDNNEIMQALRYQQYEYTADVIALASLQDERYFSAYIRELITLQLSIKIWQLTDLLRVPTTGKFYNPKEILSWVETNDNSYGYTVAKTIKYIESCKLRTHPVLGMRINKILTAWAAYEIHCNGKDFNTAISYVSYKTKDLISGFGITHTHINKLLIDFIDGWRNEQKLLNEQYK